MPTFRLYDTQSRSVKPVETQEPGHLKFYCCGPTVYSYAHIGNFRTFIASDLVVRTATALGWRVTYVSNITDVGHMTQDDVADAGGEDKMEKALKSKEGDAFANIWDLARHYADAFEDDWNRLNLQQPTVRPRATEHMREQIVAIQGLIEEGHAYETPTGVYFRVSSFDEYGKLSGNRDQDSLMRAVRAVVQDDNKEHPADFALWKKDDKHLMQWFSPWGWGFPGWHIECSAMSRTYLGDTLDLHAGGEDLVFPHHECEIAQSECLTHSPFCGHWMHVRFLQVDGEKMAKSAGNFYTVRDLLEKGHDPMALRLSLMSTPYGKPANFTMQSLKDAMSTIERFREVEKRVRAAGISESADGEPDTETQRVYDEMLEAMCDDLNTSVAIAKAIEGARLFLRDSDLTTSQAQSAQWFLRKTDALLGVVGGTATESLVEEPVVEGRPISALIQERAEAKASRDFAQADAIRQMVDSAGIELRDGPNGTEWRRKVT
ncbi:MAG: cysteine--tRNA ligase [Fimbriimonadaceae bacterium]|nr:cysteine--tRNA ligase [Fimbriimonadaceae bacterium]